MPNQVNRIFRAQQLHDKKHYDERLTLSPDARAKTPYVDYLRPIIADADMGYIRAAVLDARILIIFLDMAVLLP